MICFKLLPQNIEKCIDVDRTSISYILSSIKDLLDENLGIMVVVNGKLVQNNDQTVSSEDEIVIVQESMGG
ncbi:MAG: hypothetical protein QXJ69_06775 [Desulfurococcaceae archaeon]